FKNKILVIGFIFTNCPDVCPITTHNMEMVQQKLKDQKINDVEFAALSFDPDRDTPKVLKEFAEVRNIDLTNFEFLTGEKSQINSLTSLMNVNAFTGDTTFTESGEPVYFFVHTDRITLVDQESRIRKEYSGSKINIDEIISDIKSIGD
ncbi:MAG: SCO family protein, partial [Ignavibacteriaceae bacterium]